MHPIADKAEIAVEFPDKLYMGQFGRHSSFEAATESDGILIRLRHQDGESAMCRSICTICCLLTSSPRLPARSPIAHRRWDASFQPLTAAARDLLEALERAPAT
jgi:hypothetical protein